MMSSEDFERKWQLLKPGTGNEINSLLFSGEGALELFLGIDQNNFRCLLMTLPDSSQRLKPVIRKNISVEYYAATGSIVFKSTNRQYNSLFNDLILSLHNKVRTISSEKIYVSVLLDTFYSWADFFDDARTDLLSEEIIMGLFGEVLFLSETIRKGDAAAVNESLSSWQGPYDKGHDFILPDRNIEVKTRQAQNIDIRISSEFQLNPEPHKALQLAVVTLVKDTSGTSLREMISETKELITERLGDLTILLKAISKKGLNLGNISEYDDLRYTRKNINIYDCTHPDFPKLIPSNKSEFINSVKYNIRIGTASLDRFITDTIEFR